MKNLDLISRAKLYSDAFPDWPPLRADDRWIDGMWVLGQNYKGSGFYGSYPPNYLKRVTALFPDAERVLHLFSGSLPKGDYTRFDINKDLDTDYYGDANELSSIFKPNTFDLIYADPPYSGEDANRYGTSMISRNKVVKECAKVLDVGGYLVWLDQMLPMFRKDSLHLCGVIGLVRSTNHRFRVCSIFKKVGEVK